MFYYLKTKFTLIFLLLFLAGFSQKIKSEVFEVSFKKFEKKEIDFFGKKQFVYTGIIKVKSKDFQKGLYRFYLPIMDGEISHLTIRDAEDKILQPRLYYDKEKTSFKFYQGTEKESSEKVKSDASTKELILSGMLIWLKLNKK